MDEDDLQHTLDDFSKAESQKSIIISTVALCAGVDIPNIRNTIIWGALNMVVDLWQQIGREEGWA